MRVGRTLGRAIAAASLLGAVAIAGVNPATASTAGWTSVTSPKGPGQPVFQLHLLKTKPHGKMQVSGLASILVRSVNIYCFTDLDLVAEGPLNSAPIKVKAGAFTAAGVETPAAIGCVLRAVPTTYTGISAGQNSGYVGAFSGPTFYLGFHQTYVSAGSKVDLWTAEIAQQRAYTEFDSTDGDGIGLHLPFDPGSNQAATAPAGDRNLTLNGGNLRPHNGPSTRSEVVIDGHDAYLPLTLAGFATNPASVPAATFSIKRHANGDVAIAATEPLMRCASNAYPPAAGSCTPVSTGVELKRTIATSVEGAVVTVHDRFVDLDHAAHSLKIEYSNLLPAAEFGVPGVRLPGQSGFRLPAPGTTKTNLPAGAHTIYLTSDLHAADGAPDHADSGLTYDRKPRVFFGQNTFGLRYSRQLPKNGSADFSFALECGFSLHAVEAWAHTAQKSL